MEKEELTTETLAELFQNDFQLTNQAIHIAQEHIREREETLTIAEVIKEIKKLAASEKAEEK